MTLQPASYPRHRFPAEIISHAVWLYHVFSLSLRDVELILAERGIVVTHESIRHWCLKFGADFVRKLRRRRPQPGDTWHLDEVFIHPHPRRAALSMARGGPARGRARHPGAGSAKRRSRQALLQVPAAWVAIQASTPHHRWSAQLWRRSASGPPGWPASDKQVLEQSSREFTSTYTTTRATDAALQVARAGAAVPRDARHDLRSLQAAAPSDGGGRVSARSDEGVPQFGDRRLASMRQHETLCYPRDRLLTSWYRLTCQCHLMG
jgi:putative transposase